MSEISDAQKLIRLRQQLIDLERELQGLQGQALTDKQLEIEKVQNLINRYDVGAELSGVAPMFFITFKHDKEKTYKARREDFFTQLIRRGIFMQVYHHGYIVHRHTEQDLDIAVRAVDEALAYVYEKHGVVKL